ncbi:hypothetical protein CRV11_00675 [Candidatus Pantoea edessiphila]|uniref:Uncharacterized protein n=1 Tax=Candidatus Pantoea edessiphila TaxID=2044610 RepID=A0A2P5SYM6_9GAMM|nr:hypothetical protein [Candidatus Pantoea edessiphila]MBK4775435.1 hypothetical protein [Pantoea sp. Edef]PPI87436.1 hypothetical protein CRV11_00675 [Candidatus Pantoea edessiphila]
MTDLDTIFEINLNNGEKFILKQTIENNFNSYNYRIEYHLIPVNDGTKIPVSLVYNRNYYNLDQNPALIYGYSAYGNSIEANFCIGRLSLLDRGFVYQSMFEGTKN